MKTNEISRFIRFKLSKICWLILFAIWLFPCHAFGQVNIQRNVNVPVSKEKVSKVLPNQIARVKPVTVGSIRVTQVSPTNGQRSVSLNADLTWTSDPSSGVTYDVYVGVQREMDAAGNFPLALVSESQTTTSYHPELADGELYYWKIVAKDSSGKSAESATRFFATSNAEPSPAVLASPANNALNVPANVTFSWQPAVDPEGNSIYYRIMIGTDPGVLLDVPDAHALTETSYSKTLKHGETYYWKVISRDDAHALSESEEFCFTVDPVNWTMPITSGTFTDSRDDQTYNTVIIGAKEWMAENLAYLPAVNNMGSSANVPMYKVYDYLGTDVEEAVANANYQTYGVLYNWNAAQVACPEGWHLPTDEEWKELASYLGMEDYELNLPYSTSSDIIADKMREQGSAHWDATPVTVSNAAQFNAVPAGSATNYGYNGLGGGATWWTSTWSEADGIMTWNVGYADAMPGSIFRTRTIVYPWNFKSIRCVKD